MSYTPDPSIERRGALRWLAREIFGVFFVAALLFGSAGRFDWPGAWLTLAIYAVWIAANALLLMPRSPGLLAERAKRQKGMTKTDNIILGLFGIGVLVKYILAGLQVRFGGSGDLGLAATTLGLALAGLGYGLVTWSMVANAYFSMVLRIQEERGQKVINTGPYKYIRHPGYLGSALFDLGTPFVLGSSWAIWVGIFNAILMIIRTAHEDQELFKHLPGYEDYAKETPYRLIPGIW